MLQGSQMRESMHVVREDCGYHIITQNNKKQWNYLHLQQPLHCRLLSIFLSELFQRAVVPTQWSEQHLFSLLFHTTIEQGLCKNSQVKMKQLVC